MEIVAHRVVVRDKLEYRSIAAIHVEEAHRNRALLGALVSKWYGRRLPVIAEANSHCDPGEEIVSAFVELLPHLKEAMRRISGVRELISGVVTDLEGAIGQVRRKTRIGNTGFLPECKGCI